MSYQGQLKTRDLRKFLESVIRCQCTQLEVPFACHSPAMDPILDDLAALGRWVKMRPPSIPVVSMVFGRVVMPGDDSIRNSEYLANHCAYPVRFVDAIESYVSCSNPYAAKTTWIEIGPHAPLLPILKSFPFLSQSNIIASLHKGCENIIQGTCFLMPDSFNKLEGSIFPDWSRLRAQSAYLSLFPEEVLGYI